VPIDGADLGTDAAPRLLRSVGAVMGLARWHELHTRGQLRGLGGADIAIEPDTAVAGADKQVDLPIAVPVTGKRPGVAVRDLDRFAAGHQLLLLAESILLLRALVGHEVNIAADVADEQVDQAVAVPIDGMNGRGRAGDAGLLALRHLNALAFVD